MIGLLSGCSDKSSGVEALEFKVVDTSLAKGIDSSRHHDIPFDIGTHFSADNDRVVT